MSIEVQDLVKSYGQQLAVNHISFSAKQGQIIGFLGPNGAGKSTTMKIATGFIPPDAGTITVCGFDVVKESIEVRKRIGYLAEHNPLYLDLYVREYLEFIGSMHSLGGKQLSSRIDDMIDMCGLSIEKHKKIGALSKGYRQRVGLAQALLHDPEVLILDEPTTGLDPNQLVEIRSLIKKVSADKTVVLSTHIMQEVQALCDEVVIINKGAIVANDKVDNLKKLQSGYTIVQIEFDAPIDVALFDSIEAIKEIKNMSATTYEFSVEKNEDIRGAIFNLAKEHNLVILEMHQKESSLESIFHQLTHS